MAPEPFIFLASVGIAFIALMVANHYAKKDVRNAQKNIQQ